MTNTIYEVTLAADRPPVVTIKGYDQAAVEAGLAWAKEIIQGLGTTAKSEAEAPDKEQEEEVPVCAIHKVPMVKVNGKRGEFWSCHQKNSNGKWCSYRPITP